MYRVICFDLYNTLTYETNKGLVEMSNSECHQEIEIVHPSYLDYFVGQYEKKYSLIKEEVNSYVRNRLMNNKQESFEEMTKMLFCEFVPNEPRTTREAYSTANLVEWYWRLGSGSAEWIDKSFPFALERLRTLGYKVTLITNCTFPARLIAPITISKYPPYPTRFFCQK